MQSTFKYGLRLQWISGFVFIHNLAVFIYNCFFLKKYRVLNESTDGGVGIGMCGGHILWEYFCSSHQGVPFKFWASIGMGGKRGWKHQAPPSQLNIEQCTLHNWHQLYLGVWPSLPHRVFMAIHQRFFVCIKDFPCNYQNVLL